MKQFVLPLFFAFLISGGVYFWPYEATKEMLREKDADEEIVKKKVESGHEVVVKELKSGRADASWLRAYFDYKMDDEELRRGLQGGEFNWEIFWKLLPRWGIPFLAKILLGNTVFLPLLTFSLFGKRYEHICLFTSALPALVSAFKMFVFFEEDLFEKSFPGGLLTSLLGSSFMFYFLFMTALVEFRITCRTPGYLMIALNSPDYPSLEEKVRVCHVIIDKMVEKDIDFRSRGLLWNSGYEDRGSAGAKQGLKEITERKKKAYGHYYEELSWRYYILLISSFLLDHASFKVKYVTAQHLAYKAGLTEIVHRIKEYAPDIGEIEGCQFEDPGFEVLKNGGAGQSERELVLRALLSFCSGSLPISQHCVYKKPEGFANEKNVG